ncbi:MAG: tripartite tricarboxylate transporter substrate binding protein [Pigmentiphaga sp.]
MKPPPSPSSARSRRHFLGAAVASAAAAGLSGRPSWAANPDFPSRPIKIVVPYAPGGGVDLIARLLADALNQRWGQTVVVENRSGASTIIGTQAVTKAEPDGYTLLLTSEATITSNPFLFDKLPYDPFTELAPVSQLISLPQMVVAHPALAAQTLEELVALARRTPDAIAYASYGSGSLPHLFFEGLKKREGISLTQVPYRGIMPAVTAVLAGEVQLTLAGVSAARALLEAGKLKALALADVKRLDAFPEVPTLHEKGYADIDPQVSWFGLFATGGTPPAIVQRIQQAVAAIGNAPSFREKHLDPRGFTPIFSTPEAFAERIREEADLKAKLIALTGAKAE